MNTIEELYGIGEGRYAIEYHDVEEDDGIPYEDGELAYAFFSIDSNGCLAYLGYASKQVQESGTEDECEFSCRRRPQGTVRHHIAYRAERAVCVHEASYERLQPGVGI